MSDLRKTIDGLKEIAASPRKQLDRVLAEGKKAVGVIPYFAPEELVYAAGMVPFGMWGAETQVTESKRYYPAFYCSILHTALDLGIKECWYGHLHGERTHQNAVTGEYKGIDFHLIACDYTRFIPILVK